jgi:predicted transcriptional regulator
MVRARLIATAVKELERDGPKIIHCFRKQHCLSLADLEKLTGINRPNLSAMENGKRKVTFATLAKLAEVDKRLSRKRSKCE